MGPSEKYTLSVIDEQMPSLAIHLYRNAVKERALCVVPGVLGIFAPLLGKSMLSLQSAQNLSRCFVTHTCYAENQN